MGQRGIMGRWGIMGRLTKSSHNFGLNSSFDIRFFALGQATCVLSNYQKSQIPTPLFKVAEYTLPVQSGLQFSLLDF